MEKMTIYDVAKLANVSPSTVSRVVNGTANVRDKTKRRVLEVLNDSRFVPDETARGLASRTTKLIGILISDLRTTHHADGVYLIQRELSELGYSCLIYNTGIEEEEQSRAIRMISQRHADAACLMGSIYQNDAVKNAIKNDMPDRPVILCNGYLAGENIYGLISDEMEGVYGCVRLLKEQGRRNIAFLINRVTPSNSEKREGFEHAVRDFYPGTAPNVIITGDADEEVHEATCGLIKREPQTDGIIFAEDRMAFIGLHALGEAEIPVPKRVSVIGINNSRLAQYSIPSLTSLDNMLYDMSMTACRNLFSLLQGERVPHKMMIYSEIVERAST